MSTLKSALLATMLHGTLHEPDNSLFPSIEPCCQHDADQQILRLLVDDTERMLAEHDLTGLVTSRRKSTESILSKMRRKQLPFEGIVDRIGLRVMVATEAECYAVADLLRERFRAVSGEDDDYIANPKPNGYRSLHMALHAGPRGEVAEYQVRTFAMHAQAEHGSAAHWRYKLETAA